MFGYSSRDHYFIMRITHSFVTPYAAWQVLGFKLHIFPIYDKDSALCQFSAL
jgi:hypothetical protein